MCVCVCLNCICMRAHAFTRVFIERNDERLCLFHRNCITKELTNNPKSALPLSESSLQVGATSGLLVQASSPWEQRVRCKTRSPKPLTRPADMDERSSRRDCTRQTPHGRNMKELGPPTWPWPKNVPVNRQRTGWNLRNGESWNGRAKAQTLIPLRGCGVI